MLSQLHSTKNLSPAPENPQVKLRFIQTRYTSHDMITMTKKIFILAISLLTPPTFSQRPNRSQFQATKILKKKERKKRKLSVPGSERQGSTPEQRSIARSHEYRNGWHMLVIVIELVSETQRIRLFHFCSPIYYCRVVFVSQEKLRTFLEKVPVAN